jgi:hypothetical protein
MRIYVIGIAALLAACTSSLPVVPTGNAGEYLVVARNSASVFSSLEEAQKEAQLRAMEYCRGMGKPYIKRYSIDRPMAIAQVPESSLYFSCGNLREVGATAESVSDAKQAPAGVLTLDQAKTKCLDLGFKAGTETFGQCVLKIAK